MPKQYWYTDTDHTDEPTLHPDSKCRLLNQADETESLSLEIHPPEDAICQYCGGDQDPYDGEEDMFPCEHCSRVFDSSGGLSRHVLQAHPEVVEAKLASDGDASRGERA